MEKYNVSLRTLLQQGLSEPEVYGDLEQVAQRATIAYLSPMCQGQILFKKSGDTDVLDAQGQLIPQSVVGSGRNSNSFKHLCMFLLPASMKMIGSKTAEKTWRHCFHHYKSLGIFSGAQGQLTP